MAGISPKEGVGGKRPHWPPSHTQSGVITQRTVLTMEQKANCVEEANTPCRKPPVGMWQNTGGRAHDLCGECIGTVPLKIRAGLCCRAKQHPAI